MFPIALKMAAIFGIIVLAAFILLERGKGLIYIQTDMHLYVIFCIL